MRESVGAGPYMMAGFESPPAKKNGASREAPFPSYADFLIATDAANAGR